MDKRAGTHGNVRKEEAEIQHLSETFLQLHLRNHRDRQEGHIHNTQLIRHREQTSAPHIHRGMLVARDSSLSCAFMKVIHAKPYIIKSKMPSICEVQTNTRDAKMVEHECLKICDTESF